MTPHLSIAFDSARPVRPTSVATAAVLQARAKAPPPDLAGLLMVHLVLGLCAGLLIGTGLLVGGHAWWLALLGYTSGGTLVVACALAQAAWRDLKAARP